MVHTAITAPTIHAAAPCRYDGALWPIKINAYASAASRNTARARQSGASKLVSRPGSTRRSYGPAPSQPPLAHLVPHSHGAGRCRCRGRSAMLAGMSELYLAQEPAADAMLRAQPLALFIGMLLDQQIPLEKAFVGPLRLAERLGVAHLDAAAIADHDPVDFAAIFAKPPAIHRFPGSMAERTQ